MLDEFPTVMESRKAVQQLSSDNTPGADTIAAEVYETRAIPIAEQLTKMFTVCGGSRLSHNNLRMHP